MGQKWIKLDNIRHELKDTIHGLRMIKNEIVLDEENEIGNFNVTDGALNCILKNLEHIADEQLCDLITELQKEG